jgi:MFS family permease
MMCLPKPVIGLMGSSYFAGWTASILFVSRIADSKGRKAVFFWSLVISIITMFCMVYVSRNFYFSMSMMFISGAATSGRTTTGYIYAGEFLAQKWRIAFGVAFIFLNGLTGLLITLYFDFVNKHYVYIAAWGIAETIIAVTATKMYGVESPLWLLKKGRVMEAQVILRKLQFVNKVDLDSEIDDL